MQNIPLFGGSASKISPPALTVTSGYFPLQYLPAENLNYYLNGATQAIQEIVSVVSFAGLSPSTSLQLLTAISGILGSAFAGTYVNKVAFTQPATLATLALTAGKTFTEKSTLTLQGTDGNVIDTDAIIRSVYQGLIMSRASTTTFTVGAGCVGDDTFVSTMFLSATITKSTSAWAVGSGNGGLDTGAIAASTMYYVYVIKRPDTQVVDVLFSASATAPTLPANYTLKRLIGALLTNGSSQFVNFIGYADGTQAWVALTADVNDATLSNTRKTYTVATIPNVKCVVAFNMSFSNAAVTNVDIYGDTNLNDTGVGAGGPVISKLNNPVAGQAQVEFIARMVFTGNSLYARAGAASSTLEISVVSFNVRPFN